MRLLGMLLMVSVLVVQNVFAENVYNPQFQVVKSFKIAQLDEDENGSEKEVVVIKQELNNDLNLESFKIGEFENISKEDLIRLLEATRKNPSKEEPKEEPKKEEPKTEEPKTEEPKTESVEESTVDGVIKITDKLIALGEKIYKIVASGKPELTMSSNPISVVPTDDKGAIVQPFLMENWQAPKSKKFRVTIENYMGIDVVDFEFMVIFSYGGSFGGSGSYLTSAQIKPTYVDVTWGFTFDVNCSLQSIMNRGSKENPVAGALLMVDYRVLSVIQERVVNKTFYIDGLGNLQVH